MNLSRTVITDKCNCLYPMLITNSNFGLQNAPNGRVEQCDQPWGYYY